jgi:hypothetical protein
VEEKTNDGVTVVQVKEGADYVRAVPRGGTSLALLNLEFRRAIARIPLPLQLAVFVDAGNVWDTQNDVLRVGNLRATPGAGLRVGTPIGPVRIDVGYQPYEAPAGRALYFEQGVNGASGRILCASPGNMVSIDPNDPGDIFKCPETYRPPKRTSLLSRLVFHFGLGQAF